MRRLVGFVLLLLALGTLRMVGCGDDSPCGDCSDGNPCTRDFCDSYSTSGTISCDPDIAYRCEHDRVADGTGCSVDGRSGACVSGRCDPCAIVECPPDENECTTEYCSRGDCLSKPVTDGTPCTFKGLFPGVCVSGFCGKDLCEGVVCDDDDACTDEACDYVDGTCDFTPVVCDRSEPCTRDTCDPVDGCMVEDGTAWVGRECGHLGSGMCQAGDCVDACDAWSQEEYPCPIKGLEDWLCCPHYYGCEDDCYVPECETVQDCDDDNECTEDSCDDVNGTCYFTPAVCNDGNPCTVDQCDPASGLCIADPALADGLPCDLLGVGDGVCSQGECVGPGLCEGVDCTSPHECTQDGTCDPADGQCIPGDNTLAGEPCGLFGVGDGVCDGAGTCVECNDTPDCGEADQCLVWICVDTSCVEEAVPDGTECDALGIGDGTCLQGICVAPPP